MRASAERGGIGEHTFFLDKCLGTSDVRLALTAIGARVEVLLDHFEQDVPDHEWIKELGRRGWVILSKDRHIRSNALEVRALLESGTAAFILNSAEMNGSAMAAAYQSAMPTMLRFLRKYQRPFIATVTATGAVKHLINYGKLQDRLR